MPTLFARLYPEILKDATALSLFSQYVKRQEKPTGSFLAIEGEVNDRLYYLQKGLARVYYTTAAEADQVCTTTWFVVEGNFAVVPGSFFRQQPATHSIQLLEDSVVHSISYDELQQIYTNSVVVNSVARQVLEEYLMHYEWRIRLLRLRSSQARYDLFTDHFGLDMNRMQLRHVASLLGMKPETISRIRSRIQKAGK